MLDELEVLLQPGQPLILNVDLDYFFDQDKKIRMFTDNYIDRVFEVIKQHRDSIDVLTICLSPECCIDWKNAETVWRIAEEHLQTGLQL